MIGSSPVAVALHAADALESCGVRYVIGGSLPSSISGEPRSTLDVDIVVEMSEADVPRVVAALTPEFEVDDRAVTRAVRTHSSVNVFHRSTAIKVDLFIAGGTPLDTQQMERRQRIEIGDPPGQHLYVYTPEDILLQKLRWFRLGNEVSDRQWRDIVGILLVQGDALDRGYLQRAAATLDVVNLLARAVAAARL
ncbi:MAG: hypothetical protein ACRD3G_13825 [Vicinamibacterales bacterium]